MPVGRFICGIGALIRDPGTKKYLLLRRSAQKDVGAGHWECPTGRVDQGESFEEALQREAMEEIGVRVSPYFILGTTHFYRGEKKVENELNGLIYACSIVDPAAIRIGEEHSEMRWMSAQEIKDFLPPGHWLHWCIRRNEEMIKGTSRQLKGQLQKEGFEIP